MPSFERGRTAPEQTSSREARILLPTSRAAYSTVSRAALLAALVTAGTTGCGSEVTTYDIVQAGTPTEPVPACSPIPDCPIPTIGVPDTEEPSFYDQSGRWRRIDPVTGEQFKVCEPVKRDFCEEGENPQDDGCEPPVCENATMCDPIQSAEKGSAGRYPYLANFPRSSVDAFLINYAYNNDVDYPTIYDITPDCEPGETPEGDSYYSCDLIETCEDTIPYCDPLPRCKEGESPISCEENVGGYSYYDKEVCLEDLYKTVDMLYQNGLEGYQLADAGCQEEYDESIDEFVWRAPLVNVACLPTRECEEGEIPVVTTSTVDVDCGKWGSWVSYSDYTASCDPIKSCDQ